MISMLHILSIGIGGAIGAIARYLLSSYNSNIPFGTFIANILGAILIGIIFQITNEISLPSYLKPLIITGFLGALTTFSTYSLEAALMIKQTEYTKAIVYIALSNVLGISGVILGILFIKTFFIK